MTVKNRVGADKMSTSRHFWVKRGSRILGPISPGQLRQAAADGKLKPDDRVSEDCEKWVLASNVRGLGLCRDTDAAGATDFGDAQGHQGPLQGRREGLAEAAIEANDEAHWHCRVMGTEFGPMPTEELREMARSGRLTPDSLVRRGDSEGWTSADTVEGLFDSPEGARSEHPVAILPPPLQDPPVPPTSTPPGGKRRFPRLAVLCVAGGLLIVLIGLLVWLVPLLMPKGPNYGHSFNLIAEATGDSYVLRGYTEFIDDKSGAFAPCAVLVVGVNEGVTLGGTHFEHGSLVVVDKTDGQPAFRMGKPADRIMLKRDVELFGKTYSKGRFRVPNSGNLLAPSSDGEETTVVSREGREEATNVASAAPVQYLGHYHTFLGRVKNGRLEYVVIVLEGEPPSPRPTPFYFGCYASDLPEETAKIPFTSYRGIRGIPGKTEKLESPTGDDLDVLILTSPELIVE